MTVTAQPSGQHSHRHHLRVALRNGRFRRLFGVRLIAQFGDGVFQASLAGAVLFDPEHQATAADVASGFAVVLLPYSLIGPFAGVLLDRWWRQRVLVLANVLRSMAVALVALEILLGVDKLPFYASALIVLSLSRFFLAGLSASLPHVIGREELVTANALSTTLGAIATSAGGGAAIGVRSLIGDGDGAYALVAIAAVVPYLLSSLVASGFPRTFLGPDDVERSNRETAGEIARGLVAGARHLRTRRPAFLGLMMISVHRICYGLFAVTSVLLFRTYYDSKDGFFRSGIAGLGQLLGVIAVGGAIAALLTPPLSRRIGFARWATVMLALAAAAGISLGLVYTIPAHLLAALVISFCSQSIKIAVDTTIQSTVLDEFRGRIFTLYDTLFNVALVVAAVFTAVVLPDDGHAPAAVVSISAIYLLTAITYGALTGKDQAAQRLTGSARTTS